MVEEPMLNYTENPPPTNSLEATFNEELPFQTEQTPQNTINCSICYEDKASYITLTCGDSFCSACIELMAINFVESNTLSENKRICPNCSHPISLSLCKRMLPSCYITKFNTLVRMNRVNRLLKLNQIVPCPVARCDGYAKVFEDAELYACRKCRTGVCPKCCKRFHPQLSCDEALTTDAEDEFLDVSRNRKWRQCPYCTVYTEKIDGCNHMTCGSMMCQGSTDFCYLCGAGLSHLDDVYSHFINGDSFSSACKTLAGLASE